MRVQNDVDTYFKCQKILFYRPFQSCCPIQSIEGELAGKIIDYGKNANAGHAACQK